jgi:hypothetical protein
MSENRKHQPKLSVDQILAWADAHFERTGKWPRRNSGPIPDAPGENWANVDQALVVGLRGLPGGSSLARLLAEHRRVRNIQDLPPLSVEWILARGHGHHGRTGEWPTAKSGQLADAPGETWANIDQALAKGLRGLPGGLSLAKLRAKYHLLRNVESAENYKAEYKLQGASKILQTPSNAPLLM